MLLSKEQKKDLLKKLLACSEKTSDLEEGAEDLNSEVYINYSMQTETGKAFYQSLSDTLLLSVLKKRADQLGHSPAQKEMFWVWRVYIKARFQQWPYALKAAGLSKAAGKGGKSLKQSEKEKEEYSRYLQMIQEKAAELCRMPHPKEMPQILEGLKKEESAGRILSEKLGLTEIFFAREAFTQYRI